MKKLILKRKEEIVIFLLSFIFSLWLFFHTFSHNKDSILISVKAWSDFASHIPLIRSFSLGSNFPPQYPLFPGEPIHYHFLFYAFVGWLESIGIPIDWALNIPSALGFAVLILMIFIFAKKMFNSTAVGLLSILFFMLNSSLSFIEFFKQHPLSINSLSQIISSSNFASFGPYDNKIVSAFWNLNIYTNQRHLALSFALSLFLIFLYIFYLPNLSEKRKMFLSIALGITLGFFFYLHLVALLMTSAVIFIVGVSKKDFKNLIIIFLIACALWIPQYLYLNQSESVYSLALKPGFLVANDLTIKSFVNYWVSNLGIQIFLIALGVFFADKKQRIFFIAVFACFAIGNLFQFSPDMAGNHKFINFFMIFAVMFSSFALVRLWNTKKFPKTFIILLIFLATFSGFIDLFPIINDNKIPIPDYKSNPTANWILKNTPKDSVFLNTNFLYDSASLAGRKIFLGWPYFAWSAGYDTTTRHDKIKRAITSVNKTDLCKLMFDNNLSYLTLSSPSDDFPFNKSLLNNIKPEYSNTLRNETIYSRSKICEDTPLGVSL